MQIESLSYKSVIKSNVIVNTALGTDEVRPSDRFFFFKEETSLFRGRKTIFFLCPSRFLAETPL